jgi:hypothetical protein
MMNPGTFRPSSERRDPEDYEKIVTHHDFDGIVSASICAWALKIDRILFTGPLTITKSKITITEKDVVCDLPYPVECGLWFDHHEGNVQELELRGIDPRSIPGRFDRKPSCSRVVHEFFSERGALPGYFERAVEEADVIDSFAYDSMEEWQKETPGKVIDWTLRVRFPSADDQNAYFRNLAQQLRNRSLDEVSHFPFVQKHLKQYREEEGQMLKIIRTSSYFLEQDRGKEIVILDLTPHRRRPHLTKNLAFLVYPEALAVLEIYHLLDHGVKSNHLGFSMALSIQGNKGTSPKNIGEIMRTLNLGDGHPGAAAGTVRCSSKQEMLKKKKDVLSQVFRLWASPQEERRG